MSKKVFAHDFEKSGKVKDFKNRAGGLFDTQNRESPAEIGRVGMSVNYFNGT